MSARSPRGWRRRQASAAHIREESLQGRAVHGAARIAAVVIGGWQAAPALMDLALDVCLGRLPPVVEGVELLLQPVIGRDPRVDGAPERLDGSRAMDDLRLIGRCSARTLSLRPKNRDPFQVAPVMARATSDKLR